MARAEMTVHLKDLPEFKELVARVAYAEDAIEQVRAICDAVEYKDPGWPDTYGPYAEGRHDLAAEVLAAIDDGAINA